MQDNGDGHLVAQTRDMSPANWIFLNPSPGKSDRQTVAPAPAKIVDAEPSAASARSQANTVIALELGGRGLRMTVSWPSEDRHGLADFVRELLI